MTQTKLNSIFNNNYKDLENYSTKASRKLTRGIDPLSILSECYVYLDDRRHDIDTESQMIAWAKTFIKNNLRWPTSPFNLKENGRGHSEFGDWTKPINQGLDSETIQELINTFESTLSSYDKRLFSIYIVQDIRKGREVAEHLDISISGAYSVITECKVIENNFKEWLKNQI
jgi:hypothetical protein